MKDASDRHVEALLDRYRTGELPADETARVEAHLEACDRCAAALAELAAFDRAVGEGYRAMEARGPAPDWGRQRAAIVERTSRRRARGGLLRFAPQAAAVAIAAIAVGVLVERGVRGPEDVGRALRTESSHDAAPAVPEGAAAGDRSQEPEAVAEAPRADDREALSKAAPPAADAIDRAPRGADEVRAVTGRREPAAPGAGLGDRAEEPAVGRAAAPPLAEMEEAAREDAEADGREEREALDAPDARMAERQDAVPAPVRFRRQARQALAAADTAAAANALSLWTDSLAPAALPEDERAALTALADSLAALLGRVP